MIPVCAHCGGFLLRELDDWGDVLRCLLCGRTANPATPLETIEEERARSGRQRVRGPGGTQR